MEKRTSKRWSTRLISLFLAAAVMACGNERETDKTVTANKFETIRTHIQAWLSEASTDKPIMSSSYLKETIVDGWVNQKERYQIVSVRKAEHYDSAGHIPHAINAYWREILRDENVARLDTTKTLVLYCYYGHGSAICYTILSLLGYKCHSLDFGMMDWNVDALVRDRWDQKADYEVETTVNRPMETYPLPVIASEEGDPKSVIKERATKYFADGNPVIPSLEVKAIVDDWEHKKVEYQIVGVRSKMDYVKGHIPHSINIPWEEIAESQNLVQLDPQKSIIVYSDNGQTGQIATTVLCLLGYKAVNMLFGMMDWNKGLVEKSKHWDGVADYPVEYGNRASRRESKRQ